MVASILKRVFGNANPRSFPLESVFEYKEPDVLIGTIANLRYETTREEDVRR